MGRPFRLASAVIFVALCSAAAPGTGTQLQQTGAGACTCASTILPVCDQASNITYGNECIAICQGVTRAVPGVCHDAKRVGGWALGGDARFWQDGSVGEAELYEFSVLGFRYVYRINLTTPSTGIGNVQVDPQQLAAGSDGDSGYRPGRAGAVRVTWEGHVYEQAEDFDLPLATGQGAGSDSLSEEQGSGSWPAWVPPQLAAEAAAAAKAEEQRAEDADEQQAEQEGGGEKPATATLLDANGGDQPRRQPSTRRRLLWRLGDDGRKRLPSARPAFPWQAVGQLSIRDEAGNAYTCTGTLVGPAAVLTAAHCVYDTTSGRYFKEVTFTPGLDAPNTPHAPVRWRYATTYREFRDRLDANYDLAVVQLAQPVGDDVGWLGATYLCGKRNLKLTTVGYPADRGALGSAYSQRCAVQPGFNACAEGAPWDDSRTQPMQRHYCDSAQGQSGAAMWDAKHHVRMVLNAESQTCDGGCKNFGIVLNEMHYKFITRNARRRK